MNKKFLIPLLFLVYLNAEDAPSFVCKSDKKILKEKNVEKKVVDRARHIFDICSDITCSLSSWSKELSHKVFSDLECSNKPKLNELLQDLKQYEKELLEIQKKIDTLHRHSVDV